MEQDLKLNREEEAALKQIDELASRSATGTKAAALDAVDLCEKYKALKGALKILVGILRKLGSIGKKAADAIEFLMRLADIACPV